MLILIDTESITETNLWIVVGVDVVELLGKRSSKHDNNNKIPWTKRSKHDNNNKIPWQKQYMQTSIADLERHVAQWKE